jgi:hypothetical protein
MLGIWWDGRVGFEQSCLRQDLLQRIGEDEAQVCHFLVDGGQVGGAGGIDLLAELVQAFVIPAQADEETVL